VDSDDDYIEPESPTGIDALLYDDDDDIDLQNITSSSHSPMSQTNLPGEDDTSPYTAPIRDDYNPSKAQNETASTYLPFK
jgi:hypothetical protein